MYDKRLGRWLSVDPVFHPNESPFTAFGNCPIFFIDPTGGTIHDYLTDKSGNLLEIRKNNEPHRLIYQKQDGTEKILPFHDPNLDRSILAKKNVGEKILILVSDANINAMMRYSGVSKKTNKLDVALKSNGGDLDFSVYYLHATFGHSIDDLPKDRDDEYERLDNLSGFVWFLDLDIDKAFNVHDASNFLWGNAVARAGISEKIALKGANLNENNKDAKADQKAISEGFHHNVSTLEVDPGDLMVNDLNFEGTGQEHLDPPLRLKTAFEERNIPTAPINPKTRK